MRGPIRPWCTSLVLLTAFPFAATLLVACGQRSAAEDTPSPDASSQPEAESGRSLESKVRPVCARGRDCASGVCLPSGTCAYPSLTDGVKNNDETDVDCGGIQGKGCEDEKQCLTRRDCQSRVCMAEADGVLRCQSSRPDDRVQNGGETDVDCGGDRAPACADLSTCTTSRDCKSLVCAFGKCSSPAIDGVKNGTETDVDCGGDVAPPCGLVRRCSVSADCVSSSCQSGECVPPSPTDGQKNGTETDVDCGGRGNPKCAPRKLCAAHDDCASGGCAYDGRCAERRSCVAHFGGDTCGRGELLGSGNSPQGAHESCCASARIPGPKGAPGVWLGKYGVTAGRVRTFLEAVGGDVRGFVQSARTSGDIPDGVSMVPSWDAYPPTSFEGNTMPTELSERGQGDPVPISGIYTSAYRQVGGFVFRDNEQPLTGCMNRAPGTHTVFIPDEAEGRIMGDTPHEVSRDLVDTKGANCLTYLMAQAFCLWDGGRLQWRTEYDAAWGSDIYPWGDFPRPFGPGSGTFAGHRFPTATDASLRASNSPFAPGPNESLELATYFYSYEFPSLAGTDYAVFIPAPGRLLGRGPYGHALTDGLMELTGTTTDEVSASPWDTHVSWSRNGSFEGHAVGGRFVSHLMNKYGKVGLRCAYSSR